MGLQIPTYFMEHPFVHRPSSNRGLAPPPIPSGSSSAAVSDLALWIWGFLMRFFAGRKVEC